jgi:hypothetical protein
MPDPTRNQLIGLAILVTGVLLFFVIVAVGTLIEQGAL